MGVAAKGRKKKEAYSAGQEAMKAGSNPANPGCSDAPELFNFFHAVFRGSSLSVQ